jgi:hypothetical protein
MTGSRTRDRVSMPELEVRRNRRMRERRVA